MVEIRRLIRESCNERPLSHSNQLNARGVAVVVRGTGRAAVFASCTPLRKLSFRGRKRQGSDPDQRSKLWHPKKYLQSNCVPHRRRSRPGWTPGHRSKTAPRHNKKVEQTGATSIQRERQHDCLHNHTGSVARGSSATTGATRNQKYASKVIAYVFWYLNERRNLQGLLCVRTGEHRGLALSASGNRFLAANRGSMQQTPMAVVVVDRQVSDGTIVPEQQITFAPHLTPGELWPATMRVQKIAQ